MSTTHEPFPLTPALLRDYFEGHVGGELNLQYQGRRRGIKVLRASANEISVEFPKSPGRKPTQFSLTEALKSAALAEHASYHGPTVSVRVHRMPQLWAILKLAFNHLQWYDDRLISGSID